MKHIFLLPLLAFCVINTQAQSTDDPCEKWQLGNSAAIATATSQKELASILQNPAKLSALFSQVQADGATPVLAATQIEALSQFVMLPQFRAYRRPYSVALFNAAKSAQNEDVQRFFLTPLRWCGTHDQAKWIEELAEGKDSNFQTFVKLVSENVSCKGIGKECSPLQKTLQCDVQKTLLSLKKDLSDEETILALDALGESRSQEAIEAVSDVVFSTKSTEVLEAGLDALAKIAPRSISAQAARLLKIADRKNQNVILASLRRQKTEDLRVPLTAGWKVFSQVGKKIALELLAQRKIAEGVPLAVASLDDTDNKVQVEAYRLLRALGSKEQSDALVSKAFASKGAVRNEAISALASVSRRDDGNIVSKVLAAISTENSPEREVALEAAPRIGGAKLLTSIATQAMDKEDAASSLAAWQNEEAVPALISLTKASSTKSRALATRALGKLVTKQNVAKFSETWNKTKESVDEETRKTVEAIFANPQ